MDHEGGVMKEHLCRGTILIVDDEPNVLWFITKVCQPMGYETLTAGSGPEALKVVEECGEKIDLILLDLKMQGMDGVDFLKAVRAGGFRMPVIVLTAAHEREAECRRIGIEAFLKKPYSLEELYDRIESIVARQTFDPTDGVLAAGMEPSARILIVDDEPGVCEFLCAALMEDVTEMHLEVRWAKPGAEALKVSRDFRPDIVILDIKMKEMWGDEMIRRFKSGEGFCPKDFIVYTTTGDPQQLSRAKGLEYKLITRPTDLDVLLEGLKKICVRHGLVRPAGG